MTRIILAVACLLNAVPAALVTAAPESGLRLDRASRLWVEGDSTLHRYRLDATHLHATVDIDPAAARSTTGLLTPHAVRSFELRVPAAGLHSGERKMDDNTRQALHATRAPDIIFRMTSYELQKTAAEQLVHISGTLALAGQVRPIVVIAQVLPAPSSLRAKGEVQLKMSDFGIEPPRFMGFMRVADLVRVGFDVQLLEGRESSH